MTTSAIIMMIVAMLILWGGLVTASIRLMRREDFAADRSDATSAELHRDL